VGQHLGRIRAIARSARVAGQDIDRGLRRCAGRRGDDAAGGEKAGEQWTEETDAE
jgi:hypothetical protein